MTSRDYRALEKDSRSPCRCHCLSAGFLMPQDAFRNPYCHCGDITGRRKTSCWNELAKGWKRRAAAQPVCELLSERGSSAGGAYSHCPPLHSETLGQSPRTPVHRGVKCRTWVMVLVPSRASLGEGDLRGRSDRGDGGEDAREPLRARRSPQAEASGSLPREDERV